MTERHKVLAPLFELTEHCIFLKVALLSNYFACTVPLSTACSSVYTTLYIVYIDYAAFHSLCTVLINRVSSSVFFLLIFVFTVKYIFYLR